MDIVNCKDCGHESCGNRGKNYRLVCCSYKSTPKTATNADRIRAMTDEELAHFLEMKAGRFVSFYPTPAKSWLDWLREEAKTDAWHHPLHNIIR